MHSKEGKPTKKPILLMLLCLLALLLCGSALAVEAVDCYSIVKVNDGDSFAIDEENVITIHFSAAKEPEDYSFWYNYTLQVNDGESITGGFIEFQGVYLVQLYHEPYLFVYGNGDDCDQLYDIYHIQKDYYSDYPEFDIFPVGDLVCDSSPEQIRINLDESLTVLNSSNILSAPTLSESKVAFFENEDYSGVLDYQRAEYGEFEDANAYTYADEESLDGEYGSANRLLGGYWLPKKAQPLVEIKVACVTNALSLYAKPEESSEISFTLQPGMLVTILGYYEDWAYLAEYGKEYDAGDGWLPLDPDRKWGYFMHNGESREIDDYLYGLHRGG